VLQNKSRTLRRIAVVASVVSAGVLSTALPALASSGQEGIDPGSGLGLGLTLLIFIGIPLGVFVLLTLLVYGPGWLRRPRYRPGYQEWGYRPLWIGGPEDPDTALTASSPDAVIDVRGGGAGASW
jgi:hypothetical protein